ncbi:MAG: histidine phosphatase family protein [Candidatus Binataceae bacterium]
MGRLILVRHAESEGNAIRRFTATPETLDLTELGRRQAALAAAKIGELFRPVKAIASDYRRAAETGRIITAALGIPLELEPNLRERNIGDLVGQPYDSVARDPSYDPARSWLWRPPGGESLVEVMARSGPVLDRLAARYGGGEIVVVSHGGVMRALWAHVTGSWEGAHIPANCGIVVVEHEAGRYGAPRVIGEAAPARDAGG